MTNHRDLALAKAQRLRGMKKESDGIALGDAGLREEGRREQQLAREREAAAKAAPTRGRPERAPEPH
ncbi:hypothetical protein DSC45_20685 [Streptomyces sp. YIM 130001]|nr:hypothetical protein DSC45_20685 [Streptomyces sp. YIM 130001]